MYSTKKVKWFWPALFPTVVCVQHYKTPRRMRLKGVVAASVLWQVWDGHPVKKQ